MIKFRLVFTTFLAAVLLVLTGCSGQEGKEQEKSATEENNSKNEQPKIPKAESETDFIIKAEPQKIEHVHGIGYPGNDEGLYVASHHGLKIFKTVNGWKRLTKTMNTWDFRLLKMAFLQVAIQQRAQT
ncbi:hypothetical protein [Mesobacillus sp.]|uniref:hypothetical protein n=1 Tax=Mesobacillus sp. TaxID=2675271 RepID=UPI0039EFB539